MWNSIISFFGPWKNKGNKREQHQVQSPKAHDRNITMKCMISNDIDVQAEVNCSSNEMK